MEQYQLNISKRSTDLQGNSDHSKNKLRDGEVLDLMPKCQMKTGKTMVWWKPTDQRKWGKLQWLNDPSQIYADGPNNVRHETNTQCRNKRSEYLKSNYELYRNSMNKNIWHMHKDKNEFKMDYQPRTDSVNDEKGNLVCTLLQYFQQTEESFLPGTECMYS
jgi:hypothetical protein